MSYNQWTSIKLSNIGDIVTGKTPPTKDEKYWGGTIPFLTPTDNMDQKNISETIRFLSKKASEDFPKLYLPIDSICVSCIGSDLGKVVKVKRRLITNQQINSIIPKPSYHPDFIYYSMIILGKKMNYLSKTSTAVPIINKSTFSNFDILVPNYNIQKAIANILSSLDDKIELNNKINKNLEEMAQTLYKQWFVDFEFPNENGEPYKSSGGEMVESELGLIPKGWELKTIDAITIFNKRGIAPKYTDDGSGIPVINQRCIRNHTIIEEAVQYHDPDLKKTPKDLYHSRWDVLINSMGVGTLGRVSVSSISHNKLVHSCITILRSNTEMVLHPIFAYMILSLEDKLIHMGEGSTGQTSLNNKLLGQMKVAVPPLKLQENISNTIESLQKLIDKNYLENDKLVKTRDELLPKLMNGEIEVPIEE